MHTVVFLENIVKAVIAEHTVHELRLPGLYRLSVEVGEELYGHREVAYQCVGRGPFLLIEAPVKNESSFCISVERVLIAKKHFFVIAEQDAFFKYSIPPHSIHIEKDHTGVKIFWREKEFPDIVAYACYVIAVYIKIIYLADVTL